jgi:hypothetical protein
MEMKTAPKLVHKAIIFGAYGRVEKPLAEIALTLTIIEGVQLQKVEVKAGQFFVSGWFAREHPRGELFVGSALGEIKTALETLGARVDLMDSDLQDHELG